MAVETQAPREESAWHSLDVVDVLGRLTSELAMIRSSPRFVISRTP